MSHPSLAITLVQPLIAWEDKAANLAHYDELIAGIQGVKEVVVLPEMFSTGFSMAPGRLAEDMDGPTLQWMRSTAQKHRIILTGSVIIAEEGRCYNRLIWMQPDGRYYHYDKRHLFAFAGEHQHYTAGQRKLIVQVKGWKICPLICYDLRFPVWSRHAQGAEYDALLYVANWPQRRALAWNTLLQARAIENQCYTIGVNRVGLDGNNIDYIGDSSVFDPSGQPLLHLTSEEAATSIILQKEPLLHARSHFPFLTDADPFIITQ